MDDKLYAEGKAIQAIMQQIIVLHRQREALTLVGISYRLQKLIRKRMKLPL